MLKLTADTGQQIAPTYIEIGVRALSDERSTSHRTRVNAHVE